MENFIGCKGINSELCKDCEFKIPVGEIDKNKKDELGVIAINFALCSNKSLKNSNLNKSDFIKNIKKFNETKSRYFMYKLFLNLQSELKDLYVYSLLDTPIRYWDVRKILAEISVDQIFKDLDSGKLKREDLYETEEETYKKPKVKDVTKKDLQALSRDEIFKLFFNSKERNKGIIFSYAYNAFMSSSKKEPSVILGLLKSKIDPDVIKILDMFNKETQEIIFESFVTEVFEYSTKFQLKQFIDLLKKQLGEEKSLMFKNGSKLVDISKGSSRIFIAYKTKGIGIVQDYISLGE